MNAEQRLIALEVQRRQGRVITGELSTVSIDTDAPIGTYEELDGLAGRIAAIGEAATAKGQVVLIRKAAVELGRRALKVVRDRTVSRPVLRRKAAALRDVLDRLQREMLLPVFTADDVQSAAGIFSEGRLKALDFWQMVSSGAFVAFMVAAWRALDFPDHEDFGLEGVLSKRAAMPGVLNIED